MIRDDLHRSHPPVAPHPPHAEVGGRDDRRDRGWRIAGGHADHPAGSRRRRPPIPPGPGRVGGEAAIHAQMIGERRGLRAGPTIHDEAKATYTKTEWSGEKDRRRPRAAPPRPRSSVKTR